MEEKIFPKWLSHLIGIFFSSTESRTSKQVLPSAWKGNDHQALVRLRQKQIPPPPSGAVQHAGIKASGAKIPPVNFSSSFCQGTDSNKGTAQLLPRPAKTSVLTQEALVTRESWNSTQMGASLGSIIFLLPLNLPQGQEGTKLPFFYRILMAGTAHTETFLTK